MEEEKRKRIEGIKDEVNELHPLLNVLLPKIPEVKHVEYTHGPNEMGADFVFSRFDHTFGHLDYIAVVGKIGKIEQAAVPDVERQIDECFDAKLFNNGKDKIQVNEVWVVTNGRVSHNAKIRIGEKFKGRKINFISGDKLQKLIDDHAPNFWTDVPLQIGDYLNQLRNRNEELDRSMSLIKGPNNIYVDQDVYTVPENQWESLASKKNRPHKVNIFESIQKEKFILVEGEMGAGKSKLLRHIIRHFTNPHTYLESGIIPIFISFKNLIDKFDGNLERVIKEYVPEKALADLDVKNNFLLLVDAVDEKNLSPDEQSARLNEVIESVSKMPNVRAVFTVRSSPSSKQDKEILKKGLKLQIQPLSTERVIEFLKKLCSSANLSKRIFEDLKKSHLFKEMPKSPIAAILLANLLQESAELNKDLPCNMTELYSKYTELALGRWDMDKGFQTQAEYEALEKVLFRISKHVIENEIHYVSLAEIKEFISSYLRPRNLTVTSDRLYQVLRERSGILMVDELESRACFKHRTFAEYFYAKAKIHERNFVVDNRAFSLYWMNTFFFYVGLLKDCPELLDAISDLKPNGDGERVLKMINMGNYFMAGFASPYDAIERGLVRVVKAAADHYADILGRKIESPLAVFSEMHLLWLFQAILRDSYTFEFFAKAVEHAFLEIDESNLQADKKAYALFFLNVIYNDLNNGKESFRFILEKHAKQLPLSVQLGISHESKDAKDKNILLKNQEKALRRSLKANRSLRSQLENMYERPIKFVKGGNSRNA